MQQYESSRGRGIRGIMPVTGPVNVGPIGRWASLGAGVGLAVYGLTRRTPAALAGLPVSAYLLVRGGTGYCAVFHALGINGASANDAPTRAVTVEQAITVHKPAPEVYNFWRDLENLPRFMTHLRSVVVTGPGRSHWVVDGPLGRAVEWDAEIINEQQDEVLAWRSVDGAQVATAGFVRFEQLAHDRGTVVRVKLEYTPPSGVAGTVVAKLFGSDPDRQIEQDLHRFKQMIEAGEAPSTDGQPSAREGSNTGTVMQARRDRADTIESDDRVEGASEASFPASDAPAWTQDAGHGPDPGAAPDTRHEGNDA